MILINKKKALSILSETHSFASPGKPKTGACFLILFNKLIRPPIFEGME